MINSLLTGFLNFLSQIITLLLSPLNTLLATYVPQTSTAFSYITGFFSLLENYSGFVISYTGFTPELISIFIMLFIGIITIPFMVHGIKLIAKWWEVLV